MATIENISVEGFQALFAKLPYIPTYVEGKAYFEGDVVYYGINFYKSLTNGNLTLPTDIDNWQPVNDSTDNYIQASDIQRAFAEAKINFNTSFWQSEEDAEMVFYYLTAHYLMIDLNNSMNPLALGYMGFTQSKSVGSVSESYAVPQWMLNNKVLSSYAQTGFGRKYLSLIQPYLIGNIILTPGRTTCG